MAATAQDPHGREATSPAGLPATAWREVMWRVWTKTSTDNISLLAAGVAFYAFLSIVPLFGALIMTYGLVADPSTVGEHVKAIMSVVPADAAKLIYEQLMSVTTTAATKKGLGLAVALLISIYGAMRASGAIMEALNVIYEQVERRSFIRTSLISAGMVVAMVFVGIAGLLSGSVLTLIGELIAFVGPIGAQLIKAATWVVAAALASTAITAAYRYGPDRADAQWRWLSVGSLLATVLWLLATLGFGFYAAKFGNYNATYGSLGAVVVLLMWLFVSAYAVLFGAEINAEAERQTARDSTTGPEKPRGERGATVADQVAGEPGTEPSKEKSLAALKGASS